MHDKIVLALVTFEFWRRINQGAAGAQVLPAEHIENLWLTG